MCIYDLCWNTSRDGGVQNDQRLGLCFGEGLVVRVVRKSAIEQVV